jgi:hypothetical protein
MHPALRLSIWAIFYAGGVAALAFAAAVAWFMLSLASALYGWRS